MCPAPSPRLTSEVGLHQEGGPLSFRGLSGRPNSHVSRSAIARLLVSFLEEGTEVPSKAPEETLHRAQELGTFSLPLFVSTWSGFFSLIGPVPALPNVAIEDSLKEEAGGGQLGKSGFFTCVSRSKDPGRDCGGETSAREQEVVWRPSQSEGCDL